MQHPTETQFPNGESFLQMKGRALKATQEIYGHHGGQTIAIVAHGGINRILLADTLGIADGDIFHIAQRYAALNHKFYERLPNCRVIEWKLRMT